MGKLTKMREIQSSSIFSLVFFFAVKNLPAPQPTYLRERDVRIKDFGELRIFMIWEDFEKKSFQTSQSLHRNFENFEEYCKYFVLIFMF